MHQFRIVPVLSLILALGLAAPAAAADMEAVGLNLGITGSVNRASSLADLDLSVEVTGQWQNLKADAVFSDPVSVTARLAVGNLRCTCWRWALSVPSVNSRVKS